MKHRIAALTVLWLAAVGCLGNETVAPSGDGGGVGDAAIVDGGGVDGGVPGDGEGWDSGFDAGCADECCTFNRA